MLEGKKGGIVCEVEWNSLELNRQTKATVPATGLRESHHDGLEL